MSYVPRNTSKYKHPERIWDNVIEEPNSGCWIWIGARDDKGYGVITVARKTSRAHRLVFEKLKGPIPPGLVIDHLCRNTSCVNPIHLEPVTIGENVLRGFNPPAENKRATVCKRGHLIDGFKNTTRQRFCRQCHTLRRKAYSLREKEMSRADATH